MTHMGTPPYSYDRGIPVEYGRLTKIGERLVCHLCRRDWLHLGTHAWLTHGLTAADYRSAFGLNRTTPLVAARLSRRFRELGKQAIKGPFGAFIRDEEGMKQIRPAAERARRKPRLELSLQRHAQQLKPVGFCVQGHPNRRGPTGRLICDQCNRNRTARRRLVAPLVAPTHSATLVHE